MRRGGSELWWGAAFVVVVAAVAAPARAQCTKDLDCKGDRVCDQGRCVPPASAIAPPVPAPPAPAPPAAVPARAAALPEPGESSFPTLEPDRAHRRDAPVAFGIGVDLGADSVVPGGSSASYGFDGRLALKVAGGHFGASGELRLTSGDWNLVAAGLFGHFYLFDRSSSPFASVGFMPLFIPFTNSHGPSGNGSGGSALSFELGEEFLRSSKKVGLHIKARVDLPFFSLMDDSGQSHAFWVGSLVVGVEAKQDALGNFWML